MAGRAGYGGKGAGNGGKWRETAGNGGKWPKGAGNGGKRRETAASSLGGTYLDVLLFKRIANITHS